MRKAPSPFTRNPFSLQDGVTLVDVPPAPETHERRKPLRAYLSAGDNPLDRLITTLMGGTPKTPRKIEVVREAKEATEDDTHDTPASGGSGMPKWGAR